LLLTLGICIATIAGFIFSKSAKLHKRLINFWLLLTGLIGTFMLVMWLATDHQACRGNWNILWALPTNLIAFFTASRKRDRYALVALCFLLLVPVLHLAGVQAFPLAELWPLLLSLVFVYGMIFRHRKQGDYPLHA
jgi:hypothetical protein